MLALVPVHLLPVTANEAAYLRGLRAEALLEMGWTVDGGVGRHVERLSISGHTDAEFHGRLRLLGWSGYLCFLAALGLLWRTWEWPLWTLGPGCVLASLFPGAGGALIAQGVLSWTLALASLAIWLRARFDANWASVVAGLIWAFLPWWQPALWPIWLVGFVWLLLLHEEHQAGAVWPFALGSLSLVIVLIVLDRIGDAPFVWNPVPGADLVSYVSSGFSVAPMLFAMAWVALLDLAQGKAQMGMPSRAGWLLLGGAACLLVAPADTVLPIFVTLGFACSCLWGVRLHRAVQGPIAAGLMVVLLLVMAWPLRGFYSEGSETVRRQELAHETVRSRMRTDTGLVDQSGTLYLVESLAADGPEDPGLLLRIQSYEDLVWVQGFGLPGDLPDLGVSPEQLGLCELMQGVFASCARESGNE